MENIESKARLVNGVVLKVDNNHYTNANITDDVARKFLAAFPQRKDWFAVLPAEVKDAKVESSAEAVKEANKAEKDTAGVVAHKAKKTSKKRN